jgi:hypothetical protein
MDMLFQTVFEVASPFHTIWHTVPTLWTTPGEGSEGTTSARVTRAAKRAVSAKIPNIDFKNMF